MTDQFVAGEVLAAGGAQRLGRPKALRKIEEVRE